MIENLDEFKKKIELAEKKLDEAKKRKRELDEAKKDLDLFYVSGTNKPLDLPYVPSSTEKVEAMMELAGIKPGQKAADLGSGDGRVLIAMAQRGAFCFGYEIEPKRVVLAKEKIAKENLSEKIIVTHKSFWDVNLSKYDIITLYGITSIMERLQNKMLDELRPGTKVVSNRFTFPNWKHEKELSDVFLYIKK